MSSENLSNCIWIRKFVNFNIWAQKDIYSVSNIEILCVWRQLAFFVSHHLPFAVSDIIIGKIQTNLPIKFLVADQRFLIRSRFCLKFLKSYVLVCAFYKPLQAGVINFETCLIAAPQGGFRAPHVWENRKKSHNFQRLLLILYFM